MSTQPLLSLLPPTWLPLIQSERCSFSSAFCMSKHCLPSANCSHFFLLLTLSAPQPSLPISLSLSENIPPLLIYLPLSTLLSPLPLGSLPSYCSPCSFSSFGHSVFLSWILPSLPVSSLKLSLSRVWKHVNRSGCGAECMHWRCSGECVCVCKRDRFNWKPRLIPDSWFRSVLALIFLHVHSCHGLYVSQYMWFFSMRDVFSCISHASHAPLCLFTYHSLNQSGTKLLVTKIFSPGASNVLDLH